jgi:AbrB family looped-hinge helix DNA binding protein
METLKISSKNQIVIPAGVRQKLNLKKGVSVVMYALDENRAILSKQPKSYAESLRGLGKEVWEELGGSEKYLQNERNSWDK